MHSATTLQPIRIKRFDHIQMDVGNLEESIEFYSRVFGFEKKEAGMRTLTRWTIVGNDTGLFLCMHEYAEGVGQENEGLEITHFGLIVEDFENVMDRLKAFGVELFYDDYVHYHSSRSVYFYDPNGYKLEISEHDGGGIQ
ncbi:VOC family protein [Brevibacillus sp. 179-C9.3 HS]|uniref:VOC family protein n=1 Tax=unclassified Brevibacillus TaxID=2684853 RepID=UPI0039A2B547